MESANKRLGHLFSLALEGASIQFEGGEQGKTYLSATGPFGNVRLRAIWAGNGWPADVREALTQAPTGPWPRDLVVAAQRLSPGALELLEERDANWADEAGNVRIAGPGILVIREGRPAKGGDQGFTWSPSAIATAEALLARRWSNGIGTTELANLIQWSPPQISQVLQAFDEKGWTVKFGPQRGRGARRELIDADGLLRDWSGFLASAERDVRLTHRTMRSAGAFLEEELGEALNSEVRWALSGWAAAHELAPFVDVVPSLHVYVHEDDFAKPLDRAIKAAGLSDVAEGGRVSFYPAHPSILALSEQGALAPIASSPRVYADLLSLGGRGVDAAEHFEEEVLDLRRPLRGGEPPEGLLAWEKESRNRLRTLTAERPDLWTFYTRGSWSVSYRLLGTKGAPGPRGLKAILQEVAGHESGWPPWWVPSSKPHGPKAVGGMVECWLSDMLPRDPASADFWRADPQGRLFLLRPYQEDSPPERLAREPGTKFDLVLPIVRAGESLLHCERLARRLDAKAIQFMMRWTGLADRRLALLVGSRPGVMAGARASQDEVVSFVETTAAEIDGDLLDIVRSLLDPLYACFDFFEPPLHLYENELAAMRSRYLR